MSHTITKRFNTVETPNLRRWIQAGGKFVVEEMQVWKKLDGSATVWTRFSNGEVYVDDWASYAVFEEYMTKRSRNFRGVTWKLVIPFS